MSQLPAPRETPAPPPMFDPALLAALLAQSQIAPAPPSATPGASEAARPTTRPRRPQAQLVDALAYTGAGCFGLAGWALGGYVSLTALAALGLPVVAAIGWPWALPQSAQLAWLIPLVISLIEVRFWPSSTVGWRAWLFWGISLIDIASTVYGLSVALADRTIPLGAGFTLARGSDPLWLTAYVLALILTFGPEQIVLRSLGGLRDLWR